MIGRVDEQARALLPVRVSKRRDGDAVEVATWIDTAFDGHLAFPDQLIEELRLEPLAETEATLAGGSIMSLETYLCFVDWFDVTLPLPVIANEGRYPLLGTELLSGHLLTVDYRSKSVSLT
jgi:clan AA aspartic protease